jgi:hypothetical protein
LIQYTPTAVGRGRAMVAINIDMKLDFVPVSIMEFVVKKFCFDFFTIVMNAGRKFKGSKWEEKIERQPATH